MLIPASPMVAYGNTDESKKQFGLCRHGESGKERPIFFPLSIPGLKYKYDSSSSHHGPPLIDDRAYDKKVLKPQTLWNKKHIPSLHYWPRNSWGRNQCKLFRRFFFLIITAEPNPKQYIYLSITQRTGATAFLFLQAHKHNVQHIIEVQPMCWGVGGNSYNKWDWRSRNKSMERYLP